MSYQSVVLADSPAGYWRLGELTGTNANDSTANNRDGTYTGTYTQGASTLQADGDAGLTLAGAGYVTMGDVAAFEFTGAFSVEAWFLTSSVAAAQVIVGKADDSARGWRLDHLATTNGHVRLLGGTVTPTFIINLESSVSITDGRWHYIVATWDGTTGANGIKLYLDGVLDNQGTAAAGTLDTNAAPFLIGATGSSFVAKVTGSIDECAVYSSVLTATQIANHYAERLKLTSSDYTLLVNSVDRSTNAFWDSVEITDVLNEAPNTASAVVEKFVPVIGQTLEVRVVNTTVFKGTITGSTQLQTRSSTRVRFRLDAMDGMYLLDRRLVNRDFTNWSATSIANNLIASFTTGFTAANVPTSLVAVDLPNKMERVSQAFTRLSNLIGGLWYLDYTNDLHLRATEVLGNPQPLTSTKVFQYRDLAYGRRLPPTTRVLVEGQGTTTALAVPVGASAIPILDKQPFNTSGGTVISGAQIITYTGVGESTQPDPNNWQGQGAPTGSFTGVAWSPSLHRYCAVGVGGAVITSDDGVLWTTRTAAAANNWEDVVWADTLNLFVAVSAGGASRVMTSPDGITWTSRTAAAANTWTGLCWSHELTLLVAVSLDGASRVMVSSDGTTWTSKTAASALNWYNVAWSPSLTLFAAVASSAGTTSIMTSPDGTTWTTRSHTSATFQGICWAEGLGLFVGCGTNVVVTSPDGTTWTLATVTNDWWGVGWAEEISTLVLTANNTAVTNQLATSRDGFSWTPVPTNVATTNAWYDVAWAPELGIFAACSGNGSTVSIVTTTGQALDALTGVPVSGTGSITVRLDSGAEINLLVTRNDTGAQTVLAALEGGDGIHEAYIQDRRLSETGANNRGDAELTLGSDPEDAITVTSEDPFMISGRTLTVNVGSITSITARIQQVQTTWPADRKLPQRQVTATNVFKTLYQYLRDLDDKHTT